MNRRSRPPPVSPVGLDPRIVKALSHPLRYRVLLRLNEGVASPIEMARELGESVGRVSHHVRTLARIGAIELVRTVPRRGAVEHFYRATIPAWFSDEDWARVPASARDAIVAQNLEAVLRDVAAASPRAFVHPDTHLGRVPLELDEQAMREMTGLVNATLERAHTLAGESAQRREQGDSSAMFTTELVMLHFEHLVPDED